MSATSNTFDDPDDRSEHLRASPPLLPWPMLDRFFRGTQRRAHGGSGLGLAIVRQVAEAHGAMVQAANAAGGGLIVTLAFAPPAEMESRARVRVA